MKKILTLWVFANTLLLSACTSSPTHLVIAPDLITNKQTNLQLKQLQISVQDMRPARHVMQVLKKDQPAQLFSSQQALTDAIKSALNDGFQQAGAQITQVGGNAIDVTVNKALISVDQGLVEYKASNAIVLSISIDNGEQSLQKTYRIKGSSNGPLKADVAVLERDFNQQLGKLLNDIIGDPQVHQFLR